MIEKVKNFVKPVLKDRLMIFMMFLVFVFGLAFFIEFITKIKIFDKLIYVRYTSFGSEGLYKDNWLYRLMAAMFGLFVAIFHNIVIIKIYKNTSRRFALIASIFSLAVILIAFSFVGLSIREIPN